MKNKKELKGGKKMKRKKEKSGFNVGKFVTIVLLIGILVLGIFLVRKITSEPEFIIYKNECRNETTITGTKLIRTEPKFIDCNKTITTDGIFKRCWNEDSEWECDEDYCRFIYDSYSDDYYLDTTFVEIRVENYREDISEDIFENFTHYEEVCEQVEVDEIEIYSRIIYYNASNTHIPIEMFANKSYTLITNNEEYWFYENYEKISKQDLSIEWLDDNCECENYCDNPDFKEFNCKDNPCYLWKYEDYVIRRVG